MKRRKTMRSLMATTGIAVIGVIASSCDHFWSPAEVVCAGVGYDAVRVEIRDTQGNPQALNAVVTLTDGAYVERDSSIYDPLSVRGAQERGGRTYDIVVSKPHYIDARVNRVKAPGGGCVQSGDNATITVPVVLTLANGVPAVRAVRLLPPRILIDRPPYNGTAAFTPYLDINQGLSRSVTWRVTGDTASVSFDPLTGKFQYRCLAKSGNITVTALSVADSTVIGTAVVAIQGHPATPTDPPCS